MHRLFVTYHKGGIMRRLFIPLVVVSAFAGCQSMPSADTAKPEVSAATQSWIAAFNSCDVNKIVALYDQEAILWGTISPTIITSPSGIRQYFERVCSAKTPPQGALGEQHVRVYGDTAINSGTYTFTIFPDGQPSRLSPARYSFTYHKKDGQWVVVDHHSSAVPAAPR